MRLARSADARGLRRLLVAIATTDGAPVDPTLVRAAGAAVHALPAAVDYHAIGPSAWLALRAVELPDGIRNALEASYQRGIRWHLLMLSQLDLVARAFDAKHITWVAAKGPILSERIYPRTDIRRYADLDLIVRPEQFPDALSVLETLGGQVIEHDWPRVLDELKGELNVALPAGPVVDLHWSLLYNHRLRQQFRWRDTEFIERREVACLQDGRTVTTFDPTDTVLHLLVHACTAGGQRLSWMRDIQLACVQPGVSLDALVERATSYGVGLQVGVMLHRVRKTLGLPGVPSLVDEVLAGNERWPKAIAALDQLRPPSGWHGGQLSGHIVIGSTRTTSRDSWRELRDRTHAELHVLLHEPAHPWRVRLTRRSPMPRPRPDLGIAEDLRFKHAYLRAVAASRQ